MINDKGLFNWLGSANVQKIIGLVGGPLVATDFKTWTAKLASLGAGGAFAIAVHYIDYLQARVAASKAPAVVVTPVKEIA